MTATKTTAKKAPAKAAAKPTKAVSPEKKATPAPSAKKPAKAEPKLKVGQEVSFKTTRTRIVCTGRYVGVTTLPNAMGEWLQINMAPKGKPSEIKLIRKAQIVR